MAYKDRSRPKGPRSGSNVDVPKRTPQVGDRVFAGGHHGAFVVMEINNNNRTAKLQRIGPDGPTYPHLQLEWAKLSFTDEEDASQAAARIVREATEGH
jgi:hypothetical protein